MDAAELGVREALRWVVGQQVLGSKFVADLAECVVELRHGGGVVVFASGIFRELNEGVLSAGFSSSTAFDRHHDNTVDDGLCFFGGADGFFVIHSADGVAAVGDQDHHLASLSAIQRMRGEINGVEQSGGGA